MKGLKGMEKFKEKVLEIKIKKIPLMRDVIANQELYQLYSKWFLT